VGEERTRRNSAGDSGWVTSQVAAEGKVRALREERERLRAELEAKRSKGFWARLFGG
jgi:hypothetical protein